MEGEWPLVGRAAELDRVAALLRAGAGGVVLAGPAGVGKTRLAMECLRLAEERGFVSVRVTATQAASSLPFGAFAPLLPDTVKGDHPNVLRQLATAVVTRGEGRPVALLVDDLHLLDESSAALTHQLVGGDGVFVIATLRSGEPASDAVTALWKNGLAERVDVSPLTVDGVEGVLVAVLGGPVDGATAHVFWEHTRGNVLFLRELVIGAGPVLALHDGLWRLHGPLPASDRLVELIEARLGDLGEPDRGALELLALGEPLGLDFFEVDLEPLEARALVRVAVSERRLEAHLGHPLYGEVLRARLSPLRARRISRTLADALEARGARRREDVLRLAGWRLDGGGEVNAELMLTAARRARQRWALPLAERLARAAAGAGAGFGAGLLLGQLAWLQGRGDEAEQILAGLDPATDPQRALVADIRMNNLCWAMGRIDDALRVGAETEAAMVDDAARDEVAAKRAGVHIVAGQYRAALELVEPIVPRATGRAFINASFYAANALCFTGGLGRSADLCDRGIAALHTFGGPRPLGTYMFSAIRGLALAQSGRVAEAEVAVTTEYQEAVANGSVEARAVLGAVLARILVARGRLSRATQVGREAATCYRDLHLLSLVRFALAPLAHGLALQGLSEQAAATLADVDALPPQSRLWEAEIGQARAWTAVAAGDVAQGRARLEGAVDAALASDDVVYAAAALHDLARLGRARQVAERLRGLATLIDGELAQVRADHAEALISAEPGALEAASTRFEDIAADLLAAEAAADAAVAWRKAGDPRRAAAAERRAHALAQRCEGARTPALIAITIRAALTPRELEIARLAAAGVPNKEIAARLYVSLHTVQNKLHAAYEKLGIEGRAELTQALAVEISSSDPTSGGASR